MELKDKLVTLNICEDNIYLDKYVALICENKDTTKQVRKTQAHHIIPKCFFAQNKLAVDESAANKVNLLYKDHILAHYYLTLCGIGDFKYANAKSFRYMINNIDIPESEKEAIKLAEHYADVYYTKGYKGSMLGKHHTQETKNLLSELRAGKPTTAGRISIIDSEGHQKYIDPSDLETWQNRGWQKGSITRVPKFRWMHKDGVAQQVLLKDINSFELEGWVIGGLPMSEDQKNTLRCSLQQSLKRKVKRVTIHKNDKELHVSENEVEKYMLDGWQIGASTKTIESISNSLIGRKAPNKGVPMSDEQKQKLSQKAKNSVLVHKDNICKRIDKSDLEEFLKQGWQRGRIKVS